MASGSFRRAPPTTQCRPTRLSPAISWFLIQWNQPFQAWRSITPGPGIRSEWPLAVSGGRHQRPSADQQDSLRRYPGSLSNGISPFRRGAVSRLVLVSDLNGLWQFQAGATNDPVPTNKTLSGDILVPYPMESALSGVAQYHAWSWYQI